MTQFVNERDWDQFHSIKNLSMALNVEASELAEIFQWKTENESNLVASDLTLKEKLSEEIADVFLYLSRIALKSEIDIEKAVFSKIAKNRVKYPVELARGNSKKYSEF
ncbi:MAG: nucleotide pyrophosphohydrolase [Bdellovibrionales bacterium]|nr:nucleotide pyrophosphohydrolase [Bdellovibrionales bacterium]